MIRAYENHWLPLRPAKKHKLISEGSKWSNVRGGFVDFSHKMHFLHFPKLFFSTKSRYHDQNQPSPWWPGDFFVKAILCCFFFVVVLWKRAGSPSCIHPTMVGKKGDCHNTRHLKIFHLRNMCSMLAKSSKIFPEMVVWGTGDLPRYNPWKVTLRTNPRKKSDQKHTKN